MCDEVRSAGHAELADGSRFRVSRRGHHLTVELSVPSDLLRELLQHGDTGSDEDACSRGGPDSRRSFAPPTRTEPPQDADGRCVTTGR